MNFMITVEEAYGLIQKHMPGFGEASVSLGSPVAFVTAEDLVADREYPPFHRVMMDGIAVNFNIYREGKRDFKIAGVSPAGEPAKNLPDPSMCFEVMTGAPLPEGCDLVIPYEHLSIESGTAKFTLETERPVMENVHVRGSDIRKGERILERGSSLNGPAWGIATSIGRSEITVQKLPRINIISTGDELVEVSETPLDHQIRKSNVHALRASLALSGYTDVTLSHLDDDITAIEEHFESAKTRFDILIYSGGVSKGKFDFLPSTWKKLGVTEVFHGVSQRPGKPLWFGVHDSSKTIVMGLPGNPVSSLVCLHRYLLPQREMYAVLTEKIVFKKDLTFFVPVKIEYTPTGSVRATPVNIKNSGEFSALAGTDGFLELPKDRSVFEAGEAFKFFSWRPV